MAAQMLVSEEQGSVRTVWALHTVKVAGAQARLSVTGFIRQSQREGAPWLETRGVYTQF